MQHPRPQAIYEQTKPQSSYLLPSGPTAATAFYSQPPTNAIVPQAQPSLAPINQIREIQFPPDSIEAVKSVYVKRKKLTAKDLSQIDPWKLMMSLKSGLLAESTWALDVLSILLHDDSTYSYFSLQNLPGLLELLLEHFKLYLSEIFTDLFKDIVIENGANEIEHEPSFEEVFVKNVLEANERFKKKYNLQLDDCLVNGTVNEGDESDDDSSNSKKSKFKRIKLTKLDTLSVHTDHKQVVLNKCENYTLKNRKGLPVYFVDDDENLFISDMSKQWDKSNQTLLKSDADHWKKTFFSSTDFIQRTFQPAESDLLFAKNMKASHVDNQTTVNGNSNYVNSGSTSDNTDDDSPAEKTYPRFREKIKSRKFLENHENEAYARDSPPLCSLNDYRESISQKCICFSTLIRNLSFISGNDVMLSKNRALLLILGRLLLLNHRHLEKKPTSKLSLDDSLFNEHLDSDKRDDDLIDKPDEEPHSIDEDEWWNGTLVFLRENALVTISNISGTLNLSKFNEEISLPIFGGLLHWMVCRSAIAIDNFKTSSITTISPSRLSLECLVKLSILDDNVDLMLTTPPYNRDITIYETLVNHLRRNEDQTLREFALVLLYNFANADPNIARTIALSTDAIQQLIVFIEITEQNALNIINTQGKQCFKENPEAIGTTLDMVKRAALCLRCLARLPENRSLFFTHQQRLVQLVMSNVFDHKIGSVIADVMYEISIETNPNLHQLNSNSSSIDTTANDDKDELKTIETN